MTMFQPSLLKRVEDFFNNKQVALDKKNEELEAKKSNLEDLQTLFQNTQQAYLESFDPKFEKRMDTIREQVRAAKKEVQAVADQIAIIENQRFKFIEKDFNNLMDEKLEFIKDTEPMFIELTKKKDEFIEALLQMVERQRENQAAAGYVYSCILQNCNITQSSKEAAKLRHALYPFVHHDHSEYNNYAEEIQNAYREAAANRLGSSSMFF